MSSNGHLNGHGPDPDAHGRAHELQAPSPAEVEAARQQALMAARRYGLPVDVSLPAHEGLAEMYREACGLVEFWREQVQGLNPTPEGDGTSRGLLARGAQGGLIVHPFVDAHHRALDLKGKAAVACLKAGIEDARLRLEQARAHAVLMGLKDAMAAAGMTQAQQKALMEQFGKRLRDMLPAA